MIEIPVESVERAVNGDSDAIAKIILALEDPIFGLAYRMTLNIEDAKDATQEAMIRIITRMSSFNGESKFSTWAWRVAMNRILDYKETLYRNARVDSEHFTEELYEGLDMEAVETPENALACTQIKIGCASALLHCLDNRHRAALILVDVMGFSTTEAAETLDISDVALRKQVSRAREKVRNALDHCGIVNPQAPCRCYRRQDFAKSKGRIPSLDVTETMKIEYLSEVVQEVDRLAQTAVFYQSEPELRAGLKKDLMNNFDVKHHLSESPSIN